MMKNSNSNSNSNSEQPNAEDAKVTQKTYKKEMQKGIGYFLRLLRNLGCFFCVRLLSLSPHRTAP
jgi:hypothetical protein